MGHAHTDDIYGVMRSLHVCSVGFCSERESVSFVLPELPCLIAPHLAHIASAALADHAKTHRYCCNVAAMHSPPTQTIAAETGSPK